MQMMLMLKFAFFMEILVGVWQMVCLESRVSMPSFSRLSISSLMAQLSEMAIGRNVRLWGAIGDIMRACRSGASMGPPTLSVYAVEPVGVEIISPSAR